MTLEEKFKKVEGNNVVVMTQTRGFAVGEISGYHFLNIGQPKKTIEKAIERDTWMSAQEALEYGLLDKVVESYADIS